MKRYFGGLTVVAVAGFLGAGPAPADEAAGFRAPVGAYRPAPAPPMRLAEGLSAEPLARLAPAAVEARAELEAMEAWNRNPRNPTRVGFARELATPLRLELDPDRLGSQIGLRTGDGFLGRAGSGRYVWGTSVEVEGASALRLELAQVNLPAGTRLWVYGSTGEAKAFDLRRLRSDGSLVSPVIEADRIHLEVELPEGPVAAGQGLQVRQVRELVQSRGAALAAVAAPTGDACLHNAECFDAGDFPGIEAARDGVFQFFFTSGGSDYVCSGGLLADNVPATVVPWMLTAHHCIGTQDEAESIDAVFFYRYDDCAGNSPSYSSSVFGADLVVTSDDTDVTLMRAIDPGEIPAGAHYLSWTSIRPPGATVLHRISHPVRDSDSALLPQQYSKHRLDETPEFVCDGITVPNYLHTVNLDGTGISGGSSGSPVFRADGYVVGQLLGSCGDAPDGCGTDENTLDGAFSASYSLLRPYLSPESNVCVPDADTACLLKGAIKVEVDWHTASGSGPAQVMYFNGQRAENDESAFFWFFNPTNFEMGVKAVNACVPPYNRYWVFVSGLTSQGYTVTVTKMSDPSNPRVYTNAIDEIPTTDADTSAFTCP